MSGSTCSGGQFKLDTDPLSLSPSMGSTDGGWGGAATETAICLLANPSWAGKLFKLRAQKWRRADCHDGAVTIRRHLGSARTKAGSGAGRAPGA